MMIFHKDNTIAIYCNISKFLFRWKFKNLKKKKDYFNYKIITKFNLFEPFGDENLCFEDGNS